MRRCGEVQRTFVCYDCNHMVTGDDRKYDDRFCEKCGGKITPAMTGVDFGTGKDSSVYMHATRRP